MSDKPLPFVVTDRRRHTTEGEPRPDADPREAKPEAKHDLKPDPKLDPKPAPIPAAAAPAPEPPAASPEPVTWDEPATGSPEPPESADDANNPPAPTPEQMEQSRVAFEATADRLDTAIRAANPGAEHPPAMSFEALVQSVYMQAILQLGGGTEGGQQPQIDILGARQSIDMLAILNEKTQSNLSPNEQALLSSALFELRLAFLEVTQALARSAQQRAAAGPPSHPGAPVAPPTGPRIVR